MNRKKQLLCASALFFGGLLPLNLAASDFRTTSNRVEEKSKVFTDDEGSKVQIKADGTKIIEKTDGTWVQVNPDRSKLIKKPNGTSIQIKADGSKIIKKADGSQFEIKSE